LGTLDEAIKEHLELRRRQGVGEDEIQQAEAEAFGPAGDDVPGASVTVPAGEGDQLDKVFSGKGEADEASPTTVLESAAAPEAPAEEAEVEVSETVQAEAAEVEVPAEPPAPAPHSEPAPEPSPEPEAAVPTQTEAPAEPVDLPEDEADASDLLEAERASLSGHPTENYDVDAAIAEEEELDLLSEGRLSEELDRALDDPGLGGAEAPGVESAPEPEAEVVEEQVEVEESLDPEPTGDPDPDQPDAPAAGEAESPIPLEETPDFLDDPDASDELWFEQGEPKDFDFGD
jgi:hypothetical protein